MTNIRYGRASRLGVHLCAVAALGIALAGCGGGSGGNASAAATAQSSTSTQQSASAQGSTASATSAQGSTAGTTSSGSSSGSSLPTASTHSVTLNWSPPTENVDGTALTNLAGYNIHYGTTASQLTQTISISNPGIATYVVSNLTPGTYYFAVAAVNSAGTESPLSSEVSTTVN